MPSYGLLYLKGSASWQGTFPNPSLIIRKRPRGLQMRCCTYDSESVPAISTWHGGLKESSRVLTRFMIRETAIPLRRAWPLALAAALLAVAAGGADASQATQPSILAGSCANCHGTDGRSPGSIPSIAGMPYELMRAKLEAFKTNPSPDATVMPRLMQAYDTAQIEQLARYYSDIKAGAPR